MLRIRQKDIAEGLGISQSTVSLVMRNPHTPRVSPTLRQRILDHVRELQTDRATVSSRLTGNACFLVPRAIHEEIHYEFFFGSILRGVEEHLKRQDKGLLFSSWEEAEDVERLLQKGDISAVIALYELPRAMVQAFQQHGPVVLVDVQEQTPICDCVMGDRRNAVRRLMDILHQHGHRRIAFAQRKAGDHVWRQHHEQIHFSAYVESMFALGLPFNRDYVVELGHEREAYGASLERLMALPKPPTAIVAFNDGIAVRLIHAAGQMGLTVPQDLSFVGFDDFAPEDLWHPGLTTVAWDRRHLGHVAVDILYQRLQSGRWDDPRDTLCPLRIIERESVWRIPSHD